MKQDDTISVREGENFDHKVIKQYLLSHIDGIPDEALEVRQFPTGASNLTYLLKCGNWEGVLRRPPFGPLPPKAHDMKREYRFLMHLYPVFKLAPEPYILCEDETVIGAPFYVMERREGIVIDHEFPPGYSISTQMCQNISYLVVDTLVKLHEVNYKEAGLESFGHPEGFLERQVHGWIKRYERAKTDEIAEFNKLAHWLVNHIPVMREATIIHNDFKLNNMLFSPDFKQIRALVDWEMSTIADPLFDLGVALSYWVQEDDPVLLKNNIKTVTTIPGFISRRDFIEYYAKKSGRDVSSLHFYVTFAYFKLAVIVQQIYYRWKTGQTKDERFQTFNERVKNFMSFSWSFSENEKLLFS